METKRKGNIVGSLVQDADRRKNNGKKFKQPMLAAGGGRANGK